MAPQVSVIIPAYNGERYIAEAVESVLKQTYQDFEIIVVDDGSVDRTGVVLQTYDDRIHYVYQPNQGVAAARNRGLAIAQGKFIAFLDQDDVFLPDKLALQVACFEENPAVGIVHSGWRLVDQLGKLLSNIEPWTVSPILDSVAWIKQMPVLLSAMLFRNHWLKQTNGFNSVYRQACDVDMVQQLVLLGCETVWVRAVTTEYRQHEKNDSLNTTLQAQEAWAVREAFFKQRVPQTLRQVEKECRYYTLVWIAWRLYYTNHVDKAVAHLKKSLDYSPYLLVETIQHWIDSFSHYSKNYAVNVDLYPLITSASWKRLIYDLARKQYG